MSRSYPSQPLAAASAAILKDGKILLAQRAIEPGRGLWSIPGGLIDLGETAREAAIREVKEECGLEVKITRLVDVVDRITRDEQGRIRYHYLIITFEAAVTGGSLQLSGEIARAEWVPFSQVSAYELSPAMQSVIHYLKGG